jgi:lipid A ethanolaminephosphotransferase
MPKATSVPTAPRPSDAGLSPRLFIPATVDQVVLVASVYWMLSANWPFFEAALAGRSALDPAAWGFAAALAAMLVALHVLLLAPVANRWTLKPLLSVLLVGTAVATYFMQRYGVYLDPSMLRNVLNTDTSEARELLTWTLLPHLLVYAVLPLALLWRVRLVRRPWPRALLIRLGVVVMACATAVGAVLAIFQPFSSLMRNHREMRYLITPANYLWSAAHVVLAESRSARQPRQPIGLDATPGPSWAGRVKPMVVVLVVGETARAANWGLDGYARQTTPQLAHLPVVNFPHATSCGTSTEVSLPCMFAPVGRRDYDEARIRGSESLLHVLARAGVGVYWLDNQSGCKGVCDGLPTDTVRSRDAPGLCSDDGCLDEALLRGLDKRLAMARGTQIIVLHQRGNHGPAYFRRYPKAFARFQPACEDDDLQLCTREQIVNAYDNALLYTDHVLASLIAKLQAQAARVDSAMIYLSDHGESLGEHNLFLHGMPYAIAPSEQTHIPMLMWMSAGFAQDRAIDVACLRHRAERPVSHDNLFHTVLGLLDVRTSIYAPDWDLTKPCRPSDSPAAAK